MSARHLLVAVLGLLLGGCALSGPPAPLTLGDDTATAQLWPQPPAVPRYRYLGMLTGEGNYPGGTDEPSLGARLARWLTGIGSGRDRPLTLLRPQGGTVDADDRILVTDVGRAAIAVFPPQGRRPAIWTRATPGEQFQSPIGIVAVPGSGYLVTDSALGLVARLGPEGEPGEAFGADVLERPTGIARDPGSGDIYVADTAADDIKHFDASGTLLGTIGGSGLAPGRFNGPTHLSFRRDRLHVSDTLNARLQVLGRDGGGPRVVGHRGLYVGNFTRPKGVAVDSEGNIYGAESYYDHLLIFDAEGEFLLGIGGPGRAAGRFVAPAGVWIDDHDRVFVADMMNGRVFVMQYLGR